MDFSILELWMCRWHFDSFLSYSRLSLESITRSSIWLPKVRSALVPYCTAEVLVHRCVQIRRKVMPARSTAGMRLASSRPWTSIGSLGRNPGSQRSLSDSGLESRYRKLGREEGIVSALPLIALAGWRQTGGAGIIVIASVLCQSIVIKLACASVGSIRSEGSLIACALRWNIKSNSLDGQYY